MTKRILLWVGAVVALVAPLAVGLVVLSGGSGSTVPLVVSGGVPAPVAAPVPDTLPGTLPGTGDPYLPWAQRMSEATSIPAPAVSAYGRAELTLAGEEPECRLSWATLAGVARIESNHGRFAGRTLGADGRPDSPIIGIALDGSPGVAAIPDTDGGRHDGDRVWDRAVGPLQFIPGTWRRWAADGDGDGVSDPQDVDDAALAAGRYLCEAGGDLTSASGWWDAVLAYNASDSYARSVLKATNEYAAASRGDAS